MHDAKRVGKALQEISVRLRNEEGNYRSLSDIMNDLVDGWEALEKNEPIYSTEDGDYQNRCVHCGDCEYSHVIRSDYDIVSCNKGRLATIYSKHPCSNYVLANVTENCLSCRHMSCIHGNDGAIGVTNYTCEKQNGKHSLTRCSWYNRKMNVEYF